MGGNVSNVLQVLSSARGHLNDDDGALWTDPRLIPKFQEAYREMVSNFVINSIPIIHAVSSIITVPGISIDDDNVDMSTCSGYPQDMLEPIWLKERLPGQMNVDFVDMQQCDFIPQITLDTSQLIFWCWMQNTVMLRGCTQDVQVLMRYTLYLAAPTTVSASLVVPLSENFLSFRTAALAAGSAGNMNLKKYLSTEADRNLDIVIRNEVRSMQNLSAKRGAYHRGRGRNRVLRDF